MDSISSLYSLMNHDCYLTLNKFIDVSGYKIARSSVREALKKVKSVFGLQELHEVLTSFFSDLLVLQIDSKIDNLDHIITPCFLLRTEGDKFFMYVVLKINKEKVTLFESNKKEHCISTLEFQNLLKGSILIFKEEETYNPSEKVLKEYQKEQKEDKEYKEKIRVIDNFISEIECKKIINFCEEGSLFERSKVSGSYGAKVSGNRTSSSAILENTPKNRLINTYLREKIAVFIGCESNKIEKIQIVRYYKSEEFRPHFDFKVRKRKLTCLLYLNEGFLGGETYFPEVGFGVAPKRGRLLVFENLNEKDEVITQSLHQGSPILEGVKYACNIWIES